MAARGNTVPTAAEIRFAKILRIFFAMIPVVYCLFWILFTDEKINYCLIFFVYFCVSYFLSALLPDILIGITAIGIAEYSFGWLATDLYQQMGIPMPDFIYPIWSGLITGCILGKNFGLPYVSTWLKTNEWVYEESQKNKKTS
ncbi:hypothetical protein ACN08Y_04540 [Rothia sp. P5764]|uniref:hypothetical protein n=1 Tax=Rothia sp. P5764 TaxID=3402654 RepID=UPI003AD514C4